jgi:hypothetical protein
MLRKTFITLTAVAALGVASAAMAAMGGGGRGGGSMGGGGGGMMGGSGMGRGGSFGGAGIAAMPRGGAGPMMMRGGNVGPMTRGAPITTAPMAGGRVQSWGGRTAWGFHNRFHDHFHDHFHHRFHHRNFFAFGFGGPIYDYAYTCWTQVPTRYGWRWVYVCGDYGSY